MKAAAALVALVAAVLLTVWAWLPPADERLPAATSRVPTADSMRPTHHLAGRRQDQTSSHVDTAPDLSLTDNQELIPDFALRQLMDRFLLNRGEAGGLPPLEAHLRRVLPAGAAGEAIQIAANYQAYLTAHDELLAAQHFTSADAASQDLQRISSWQQQRQQLRVRTLGERITLEWFGSEDAYLGQALDEQRQRSEGQPPAADVAPADQAAHDLHMRQAMNQSIASYQRAARAN